MMIVNRWQFAVAIAGIAVASNFFIHDFTAQEYSFEAMVDLAAILGFAIGLARSIRSQP